MSVWGLPTFYRGVMMYYMSGHFGIDELIINYTLQNVGGIVPTIPSSTINQIFVGPAACTNCSSLVNIVFCMATSSFHIFSILNYPYKCLVTLGQFELSI